ncbi:hypothetical protein D3C76_737130 [compost metagenome]|uniref:hypothetical protein n=1 Tax=Pseudomonas sp. YuFO20 TaxID=3095362 RepID=UPI000FB09D03|nr:hypothetical protein [Pseudomonas sp. YuFO20]MEB2518899.1 hypothetical protein [Pseudomonas sp. YuFO20]
MVRLGLASFLILFSFSFAKAEITNYSNASEVRSGRSGGVLVRYIKTFEDGCLAVEIIKINGGLAVLDGQNICSFQGKPFSTGFAYAGFQDITFEEDGIHLNLSITPLEPIGEQLRKCWIPIESGKLSSLECSSPIKQH